MTPATEHLRDNPKTVRIISWNVNGLRQRHQLNQFLPVFRDDPDIVCIQETKISGDRIPPDLKKIRGYSWYIDEKNPENFSEVMLFSKQEPERVFFGFGDSPFDREGRVLIAEFGTFTLVTIYFPLGIAPADTLEHKLAFYDSFLSYVTRHNTGQKPMIICGDFSIAHTDSDIAKPVKKNTRRAGITVEERRKLDRLIEAGFSDTLRIFSQSDGHHSWWPNGFSSEERRLGWRLDYFFVNACARPLVTGTEILTSYEGSDHCPVMMTMAEPEQGTEKTSAPTIQTCRINGGIPG
jgi:exodeoxyribonuclease-3